MKGMITSYLASPQGRRMVQDFLSSPEGKKAICDYIATPQGKRSLEQILPCILSGLQFSPEVEAAILAKFREDG
jgi:hypothetical protein